MFRNKFNFLLTRHLTRVTKVAFQRKRSSAITLTRLTLLLHNRHIYFPAFPSEDRNAKVVPTELSSITYALNLIIGDKVFRNEITKRIYDTLFCQVILFNVFQQFCNSAYLFFPPCRYLFIVGK